ncbi:hypothetical protein [Micromonospora sp. NBC_01813]|uniref:hypothetical protein n=1 Tax=Micromonospora sp. NBC_01813 TaxID=2975988 RepID=UPI002DDC6A67|nr:hypothetical protein [Micromonospora sp. NBC_01813]WSA07460.1 hypothetical protein OG958_24895 [Micromonospora sp. NBC_01813]
MEHAVRAQLRFRTKVLRQMLNDWNYLGVGELYAGDDEYDCLLGPLLTRLAAGADADDLARFLRDRIEGHFGLDLTDVDVADFAARAVAWWQAEESRPAA